MRPLALVLLVIASSQAMATTAADINRAWLLKYLPLWTWVALGIAVLLGFVCLVSLATGKHRYLAAAPLVAAGLAGWYAKSPTCDGWRCPYIVNLAAKAVPPLEALALVSIATWLAIPLVQHVVAPMVKFFLRWRQ
jgi:hypothetical protein